VAHFSISRPPSAAGRKSPIPTVSSWLFLTSCLLFFSWRSWRLGGSTFDHADRPHARDLARQPRVMDDFHDVIDILVRLGLFLREADAALGAGDDAARLQFLVDAPAGGVLDRGL